MPSQRSLLAASAAAVTLVSAIAIGSGAALATGPENPEPSETTENSIVAGGFESAPDGAVSLWAPSYNGFSCSASRIGPKWVLTARHCAELNPSRAYTNSTTKVQGDYGNVVSTKFAPNGDVALLELDKAPAGKVLPWSDAALQNGTQVLMRGWGMDSASGTSTPRLKGATGSYAGTGTNPFYGGQDLLINGGNGAPWKGDSGGPVTKDGVLYGALSWSQSYGNDPRAQAGYGALRPHAQWIRQVTGIAPNGQPGGDDQPTGTTTQPTGPQPTQPTGPEPTQPTGPEPTTNVPSHVEVTSSNWQQVLQSSYVRPLVLDFGATWCGACQVLKPRIERLNAQAGGKWTLGSIDVDRNQAITRQYGVSAYPTVVMLWQGKEIQGTRFVGALDDASIQQKINTALAYAKQNPGPSDTTEPTDTPTEPTDTTTTEPTDTTPPAPTSTTTEPTATSTTEPTAPGPKPTDGGKGAVITLTDKNWDWFLEQSKTKPVFLDFSKEGCEPCQALAPVLEKKAKELGDKAIIGTMDGTAYPEIWKKYNQPWFPTVIAIKNGQELARHSGYANDAAEMNQWIDKAIQGTAVSDPLVLRGDTSNWKQVQDMSWRHPVIIAYYRSDGQCPSCDANMAKLRKMVMTQGGKWTLVTIDLNNKNTYPIWGPHKLQYADTIDTYYREELVLDRLDGPQTDEALVAHINKALSTHYPPKDRP